ncbi:MAG: hypothetical protein ACOYN6_08000 [Ignavibacteria bacterium]
MAENNYLIEKHAKWGYPDVNIFYNSNDVDGICSGAVAKMYYERVEKAEILECTGITNGDKEKPDLRFLKDSTVVLLDTHFDMMFMEQILNVAKRFVWVDNDKYAEEEYAKYLTERNGNDENGKWQTLHNIDRASCELTWEHFYPQKETPEALRFLGEYEAGKKEDFDNWYNYILPFKYGMDHYYKSLDDIDVKIFNDKELTYEIMNAGRIILRHQEQRDKKACRGIFRTMFDNRRALCLNIGGANFNTFKAKWDAEKYDIAIAFYYSKSYWKYKIFSDKPEIDCGDIAIRHGGNGKKEFGWFYSHTNLLMYDVI